MKKYILFICLSCMLFACRTEFNDEDAPDFNFEITTNWEDQPTQQDGIVLYLYSLEPSRPVEIHFLPYWGGKLSIPNGKYQVLVHSDYNQYINIFNKDNASEIYAEPVVYKNENLFGSLPPNTRWSVDKNFYLSDVYELTHQYKSTLNVDLKKQNKFIYLNIKINGADRLESAQATLSGYTNLNLMKKKDAYNDRNYLFLDFNIKSDYLQVAFSSFELPNQDQTTNILDLIFKTKDGVIHNQLKTIRDITKNIPNEVRKNGGVVWIDNLNITIPDLKNTNPIFQFPINDFIENTEDEINF